MKAPRVFPGSNGFWAACETPQGNTLVCFDTTDRKSVV